MDDWSIINLNDTGNINNQFHEKLKVGEQGEGIVEVFLKGRRHWGASDEFRSFINRDERYCKAQIWEGKQDEHTANLDYLVRVKPCKDCQILECRFKKDEPYKHTVSERHEVKTNPTTHTKPTWGAIQDDGKKYAPTFNLFIEVWSNVKDADKKRAKPAQLYPDSRKGWYQKEPPAWYHFYQPIYCVDNKGNQIYDENGNLTYAVEDDAVDKDSETAISFIQTMTTNDKLILRRPWGYVVSVKGEKLKEIVNALCPADLNNDLELTPVENRNGTQSKGLLLPVGELLNNPIYYNRGAEGYVIYTPLIKMVRGNNPETKTDSRYYMPEKMYNNLFKDIPGNKGKIVSPKTFDELYAMMKTQIVWSNSFSLIIDSIEIDNTWVTITPDDEIQLIIRPFGGPKVYWKSIINRASFDPNNPPFAFELAGRGIGAVGDARIKATFGDTYSQYGIKRKEPQYIREDLIPEAMLLKLVQKWPNSIETLG